MDYQGNSKHPKPDKPKPEKKIEKVVEGQAIQKKKPIGRRFKEIFFGGDVHSVTRYLAGEVLLPAFRNLLVDATNKGMERIVYGDQARPQRSRQQEYRPRVSYHNPMRRPDPREFRPPDQGPRPIPSRSQDTEIILQTRSDAERVLEQLGDILDQYEVASVADLHECVGLPVSHIDNKWGWTYLGSTGIRQIREGYILELPPTEPI